jgi:hypothetical protein
VTRDSARLAGLRLAGSASDDVAAAAMQAHITTSVKKRIRIYGQ